MLRGCHGRHRFQDGSLVFGLAYLWGWTNQSRAFKFIELLKFIILILLDFNPNKTS